MSSVSFFASLARGLSVLLIFSKNQFFASLVFSIDFLFSILVISAFLISAAPPIPQGERFELVYGGGSGKFGGGE